MNPTSTTTKLATTKPASKRTATKRTPVAPIAGPAPRTADPRKLELGDNVRSNLALTDEFLASISEHGILIPLLVEPGLELGTYKLTDGYRRHAAALQLGLTDVPIYVGKELPKVDRIAAQLTANDQRSNISTADQARGYKKMALFGLTADQIAKRTARPKAEVTAALTLVENETALAASHNRQVDLEQLAQIAELTSDVKLVEELTNIAEESPSQFAHKIEQVRREQENAAVTKQLLAELKKAKVQVVERPRSSWEGNANKHRFLIHLIDKKTGDKITVESHADCPGHGAYVGGNYYGDTPTIHYVCTDPSKYGHRDASRGPVPPPPTAEEKAARAQERQDKADWLAASTVRQTWIREQLLTRKVMPNGIALLTTQHFIGELFSPSDHSHRGTAADWLGAPEKRADGHTMYYGGERLQAYLAKHPTRYEHITAAIILAAMENVIGAPKGDTKGWSDNRGKIGPYLNTLAGFGYGLSDIEKRVIDQDAARAAEKAAS